MNRRALIASVGGAALALGAGTALWRRHTSPQAEATDSIDMWALSFPTLDGSTAAMTALRGRPLLLNFWATWCAPCVQEMPMLNAFHHDRSQSRWQVLALAIDEGETVRSFMEAHHLDLPVALAGTVGLDLSRQLGNSLGALPFSVAFDAGGMPREHKLGALDAALLGRWASLE